MLSQSVILQSDCLSHSYAEAAPFPHVVIDNFFDTDAAEMLLADFPAFELGNAMTETGRLGQKSVNQDMLNISAGYLEFSEFIISRQFIEIMEKITGIPSLIALPGGAGGTHESRSGASLAPHIDYNYIDYEGQKLHRRLNLLFYLNKDWQKEWGANFELHSNPRRHKENRTFAFEPSFNRCIIMETSEDSWHGYNTINLPDPEKQSRKSISIYLFTATRPDQKTAPQHSTFYVQKPLDEKFHAGMTLTSDNMRELNQIIAKRDNWIEFYQKEILKHSGRAEENIKKANWLQEKLKKLSTT